MNTNRKFGCKVPVNDGVIGLYKCKEMKIVVVDYGAGNIFSVLMALKRLGCQAVVSRDPEVISKADRVIFPGVGQASAAMASLEKYELQQVIVGLQIPVLGICLGMQLLCTRTEEENTRGLGVFPLKVKKFAGKYKIPHMGWNNLYGLHSPLFQGIDVGERMYFVHSYYVPANEYCIATCGYEEEFAAAIRKDNFYGCQFHPEKSAVAGQKVLKNFLMETL